MVSFASAHGDALELFEFAEEVFDEVAPFVHLLVDAERSRSLRSLGDDDFGSPLIKLVDNPVGVERLIGDQGSKFDVFDQRRNTDSVVALSGQENEAHQIAQGIGQGEYLGSPAASGLAYGLALSPPFAPWACR